MATTQITIANDEWTEVAATETSGYITANSAFPVLFGVFTTEPAANSNVGHVLPKEGFNFAIGTGESMFAKSAGAFDGASVVVTINVEVSA